MWNGSTETPEAEYLGQEMRMEMKSIVGRQICKKWQAALRDIFGLLEHLVAQIMTNKRVITYIPNYGVLRMGKFIKELILPFIGYGFKMVILL